MVNYLKKNYIYIFIFFIFLFMAYWSTITPLWTDDWRSIVNGVGLNFSQIINTQIIAYNNWSGRVFGEGISRLLVTLPRPIFGILNSLVFILLSILMLRLSKNKLQSTKESFISYFFIIISLFLLTPTFGQVFLWTSGSGNYLWTLTANLVFVWLFINIDKVKIINKTILYILMIPLAIVSGWSNENTGGGVILLLIGMYLLNYFYKRNFTINIKKCLLIVIYIFSYLALILAPGNEKRAKVLDKDFINKNFINRIEIRIPQINVFISQYLIWIILVFIALACLNIFIFKNKEIVMYSLVWFISSFAMIYAMALSPELTDNQDRVFFNGFVFLIIATISLIPKNIDSPIIKSIMAFSIISLSIITLISLSTGFIDSKQTNNSISRRYQYIKNEIQKNGKNKTVKVDPLDYPGYTKYSVTFGNTWDLQKYSNKGVYTYPNSEYEQMFGANKIILK
ncbi:hypothetical protein B808_1112 [Fructilactobacillus florum 8D]|uniref:Uncharacterized protein n=1 Tax=Fructilactobacillus florum 8D TaxID=1221538 RepID=W9ED08_9LACO|nr:DUF6056 family protein [Fructilactobacillus florum]ETO40003.1 hypothetical protein B808_1112 [Fructilactobacillus florum 8D]